MKIAFPNGHCIIDIDERTATYLGYGGHLRLDTDELQRMIERTFHLQHCDPDLQAIRGVLIRLPFNVSIIEPGQRGTTRHVAGEHFLLGLREASLLVDRIFELTMNLSSRYSSVEKEELARLHRAWNYARATSGSSRLRPAQIM